MSMESMGTDEGNVGGNSEVSTPFSERTEEERRDISYDAWCSVRNIAAPLLGRSNMSAGYDGGILPTSEACLAALPALEQYLFEHAEALADGMRFGFEDLYRVLDVMLSYHVEKGEEDIPQLSDPDDLIAREAKMIARKFLLRERHAFGELLRESFMDEGLSHRGVEYATMSLAERYVDTLRRDAPSMTDPDELESLMALSDELYPIIKARVQKVETEEEQPHHGDKGRDNSGEEDRATVVSALHLLMRMGNEDALSDIAHLYANRSDRGVVNNLLVDGGIDDPLVSTPPPLPRTIYAGDSAVRYEWAKEKDGLRAVRAVLHKYGLREDEYLPYWEKASKSSMLGSSYARHLARIRDIESGESGGAAFLTKERGVRMFGRYSKEVLLTQIAEADDLAHDYGVKLAAYADWNGAFEREEIADKLSNGAKVHGHYLRILEAGSRKEVIMRMLALHDQYGAAQKIGFLWIDGHGTPETISFGDGVGGTVIAEQLFGRGEGRSSLILKDDAPIALASCSTGSDGGFAAQGSDLSGHAFTAPTMPAAVQDLSLYRNKEGTLSFDVTYVDVKTQEAVDADGKPIASTHRPGQ